MSNGYLNINVFNSTVGKQLPEATISVINPKDGNKTVQELVTNESGQTNTITLEAPPIEYSLEPGSPMPYAEYDITIAEDGFETTIIKGIQILLHSFS